MHCSSKEPVTYHLIVNVFAQHSSHQKIMTSTPAQIPWSQWRKKFYVCTVLTAATNGRAWPHLTLIDETTSSSTETN